LDGALKFTEMTSLLPKSRDNSSLSLWKGPIEFAEIIAFLTNEQGLTAPSPRGPIEWAENAVMYLG
jgi:hypothetical protein